MTHPQNVLRRVMDRSDLTDEERAEVAEDMYYAVLWLLVESADTCEQREELAAGPAVTLEEI